MRRKLFPVAVIILVWNFTVFGQGRSDLDNYNEPPSKLRGVIEKFTQDNGAIARLFTSQTSETRAAKLRQL